MSLIEQVGVVAIVVLLSASVPEPAVVDMAHDTGKNKSDSRGAAANSLSRWRGHEGNR